MAILKIKGIGQVDKRRCRVCGCTQFHACPGGCYWVTDDLCSRCVKFINSNSVRKTNVIVFGEIPSGEKVSSGLAEAFKNISDTKINLDTSDKIEKLRSFGLTEEEITIVQKAIPSKRYLPHIKK